MQESQGTKVSESPVSMVDFLLGPGKDRLPELRVRLRMQSKVGSKDGEVSCEVK